MPRCPALHPVLLLALAVLAAGCATSRPAGTGTPATGQNVPSAHPEMVLQIGHRDGIESLAFSPDDQTLVSGSRDRTVDIWNARTGELRRTLAGHGGPVHSVAVSPDGTAIVSGSEDRTVKVWDLHTGALRRTLRGSAGAVQTVAFSPDGMTVAGGGTDGTVRQWEAQTGKLRRMLKAGAPVQRIAFSPDGDELAVASQVVTLWDLKTGYPRRVLPVGRALDLAFLRDGKTLWTGEAEWDTQTGSQVRALTLTRPLSASVMNHLFSEGPDLLTLVMSPDGATIAGGYSDETIFLWDSQTGKILRGLHGTREGVAALAFSPDGKTLASGTGDEQSFSHIGDISLWDVGTGTLRQAMNGDSDWITSAAFARDGETLVTGRSDRTGRVWSVKTGALRRTLTDPARVFQVAVSPDGKTAATGNEGGTVRLWDVDTGQVKAVMAAHEEGVDSLAFAPDGRALASGGGHLWSGDVKLWDGRTGRFLRRLAGQSEGINAVAFSPDGQQVAAGSYDNTVKLWDAQTGRLERTLDGYDGWVGCVAFSPDSKWVAGGKDSRPGVEWKIWDARTGRLARGSGHLSTPITSVAFSPDGHEIATGCLREDQKADIDGTRIVQLWDGAGKRLQTLPGPYTGAIPVAFAPNGRLLLTPGGDGGIVLRQPKSGVALVTLRILPSASDKPSPDWIAYTPEGYYDASPDAAKFIHWRVGDTLFPAATYQKQFHRPDLVEKALRP